MPVTLDWSEITLRLAMSVVAGVVIGFNRGEHGRPAGMRTTLLVCLAACVAMIQANLLMNTTGKAHDSFVVLDLMRLPLGILSGMGFIGAGAILRKNNLVLGVTTAATLWFVTVLGLCFGGGQIGLGSIGLLLGIITLWGLKLIESFMHQDARATLTVDLAPDGPSDAQIRADILAGECTVLSWAVSFAKGGMRREVLCEVEWRKRSTDTEPPAFVARLAQTPGVEKLAWLPQAYSPAVATQHQAQTAGTPTPIAGPQ